ncbi:uncharacterized protein PHA67_023605 isoform 16-T16 [Liasis olivaceus]
MHFSIMYGRMDGVLLFSLQQFLVLALACISLAALSLSLLGSGSVLAVAVRRRQCCSDQMFYAISLLMVLVYACEVNRAVRGWRVTQHSNLQENSSCFPRCQLALPYALACCLVLIHLSQDTCLKPQSAGSGPAVQGDREQGHSLSPQHLAKESSIVFLVFVALVVSGCMVLYCRVNSWHRQDCYVPRSDGLARRSHVTRRFQLVLVLCWMPACLLVLLSFTSLQLSSLFPVSVATALTAPLQGFLHSLAYGWLRGNFRRELAGERLPLHCSPGLKAFYEDSLAGPC